MLFCFLLLRSEVQLCYTVNNEQSEERADRVMSIANTIALLGGLGFFLFGMSLLGEGLKRTAGSKLEIILAKLPSTTLRGVLLGAFVTAVIQSSSATTVMVVGFVNSGIMQLANAIALSGWLGEMVPNPCDSARYDAELQKRMDNE